MKVGFLTLGCKVNYYETTEMAKRFTEAGYDVVEFTDVADVYVINTCTVTNIADRKSRQMIHRARKNNPDALVVAVGCYVDAMNKEKGSDVNNNLDSDIANIDEAIDLAIGNSDKEKIVEKVEEVLSIRGIEPKLKPYEPDHIYDESRTRAFIKIQDGCNQFCTYCLIPYVRGGGKLKSRPEDEVVAEVEGLVASGFKEVVLTGIHLSSYGVDLSDEINFVKLRGRPLVHLLERLDRIEDLRRIRLGSLEPRIITDDFVQSISAIDKLCPHFHLSLQSGCDETLHRMNRHYTAAMYREKVDLLRRYYDEPAITTDVIVGFPGETDEEFETTGEFIESIGFSDLHIFQYSVREGTKAAQMLDQVSPEVKKKRSSILLEARDKAAHEYAEKFLGKDQEIHFEEYIKVSDQEYLVGYNTRYVRFGVDKGRSMERGVCPGDIHTMAPEEVRIIL